MRISIVQGAFLPVPPLLGGAVEKAWYALGRDFAAKGHTVTHVGRSHEKLPQEEFESGVHYRRVKGYATPASMVKLKLLDMCYSVRALRVLRPADILVTNTFWLPILARRKQLGVPYVHVARFPKGQLRHYPKRCVLQTVSSPIHKAILDELGSIERKVTTVPYPISPKYLKPFQEQASRTILFTGRIHPEKGLQILIDAAQEIQTALTGWRVRIIGPWKTAQGGGGEAYLNELKAKAVGLPIDFCEPIFDEEKLVQEYQNASVFVYPSLAERGETFGLAVLEAMGSGACPIISALECFGDFIEDGKQGLIFNHRQERPHKALAKSIQQVINDEGLRNTLRASAWKQARDYSLDKVSDLYLKDFNQFIGK